VKEPGSKAAIVWVVGEHYERIPLHALDVLRKMACTQEVPVKLQVVNLAVKMYPTNSAQTKLISQYVSNLAKFDQNYDLMDRFIRAIRRHTHQLETCCGCCNLLMQNLNLNFHLVVLYFQKKKKFPQGWGYLPKFYL
jgi:hypothetical protein